MNTSIKPEGKIYRQFIASMEATTMTPQQRTTFNGIMKQYKAMMDIDYKTQDRYEQEIATLRRQVERVEGELLLAKKVIHQGEDEEEETPLPVLHMMERCDVAEAKYEELHRQILLACCDSPDLNAVASIAHECHRASGVKPEDVMGEDEIYRWMTEDVMEKEHLICEDDIDYGEAFDNGKRTGYEEGFDDGEDTGKEAERDEVFSTIEDMFRPLMSKVVAWEKEDDWDDQLRQIAERMEHHMMCQEQAETDCQNWQDRFEKEKAKEEPAPEPEPEKAKENPAFTFFPQLKEVPKMEKFMDQSGHIKMEKADMTKNTKWFDEMKKRGYLEAMKTHRKMTGSCFEWDCFDEWVKTC